jgi:hypothetical protein
VSNESVKGLPKQWTLKEPNLAQVDKVFRKGCTAVRSKRKPLPGSMIIEKAESFYDETKTTDKCISF